MIIRPAKLQEAPALSRISFQSKKYWGYPDHFFEIWKKELTITPDYISLNQVFVCEKQNTLRAYYAMAGLEKDLDLFGEILPKGHFLDHMFVLPDDMGNGIGTKMIDHMTSVCRQHGISRIHILSDPNAKGFYEKMGCRYIREYPSTIPERTTPLMILDLKPEPQACTSPPDTPPEP